jgi:hypothetical protein
MVDHPNVHHRTATHEGDPMTNDLDFLTDDDPGVPEHEQRGPLPRRWMTRVRNAGRPRCGRLRNDTDRRCRTLVLLPGEACPHHEGIPAGWGTR